MIQSTAARSTIATLERFDVEPPADAVEALAVLLAAREAAQVRPEESLGAQLLDGTLTPANVAQAIAAAASDLAARDHADALASGLERPASIRAARAFKAEGERIVRELRPAFDEAARHVEAAAKYVHPEDTAAMAARNGSGALAAFEELRQHLDVLNYIRGVRMTLAQCGYGSDAPGASWYIAGAEDLAQLAQAEGCMTGVGNTFHRLAHAGLTLRLNTPAEAASVKKGAAAVTDKRQAAEEEARLAKHREEWKPYLDAWQRNAPRLAG